MSGYCSNCQTEAIKNHNYCPECGKNLEQNGSEGSMTRRSFIKTATLGAAGLGLAGLGSSLTIKSGNSFGYIGGGEEDFNINTDGSIEGKVTGGQTLSNIAGNNLSIDSNGNLNASTGGGSSTSYVTVVNPGDASDMKSKIEGASEGETIYIPPGQYDVPSIGTDEAWITISTDGVTIYGEGWPSLIRNQNVYSDPQGTDEIRISGGAKNVTIRKLGFRGEQEDETNKSNQSGNHIAVRDGSSITLNHITGFDGSNVIRVSHGEDINISNILGLNNEHVIDLWGTAPVGGTPVRRVNISNVVGKMQGRSDGSDGWLQRGITMGIVYDVNIENLTLNNIFSTGINMGVSTENVNVSNYTLENDDTGATQTIGGIRIRGGGSGGDSQNISFTNCNVYVSDDRALQFELNEDRGIRNVNFTNCTFRNDSQHVVHCQSGTSGAQAEDIRFQNCYFKSGGNGYDACPIDFVQTAVISNSKAEGTFDGSSGDGFVIGEEVTDTGASANDVTLTNCIGRGSSDAFRADSSNANWPKVINCADFGDGFTLNPASNGALRDGWGENNGNPSSTGVWNGSGQEGVVVRDVNNGNNYVYKNGGWRSL